MVKTFLSDYQIFSFCNWHQLRYSISRVTYLFFKSQPILYSLPRLSIRYFARYLKMLIFTLTLFIKIYKFWNFYFTRETIEVTVRITWHVCSHLYLLLTGVGPSCPCSSFRFILNQMYFCQFTIVVLCYAYRKCNVLM